MFSTSVVCNDVDDAILVSGIGVADGGLVARAFERILLFSLDRMEGASSGSIVPSLLDTLEVEPCLSPMTAVGAAIMVTFFCLVGLLLTIWRSGKVFEFSSLSLSSACTYSHSSCSGAHLIFLESTGEIGNDERFNPLRWYMTCIDCSKSCLSSSVPDGVSGYGEIC